MAPVAADCSFVLHLERCTLIMRQAPPELIFLALKNETLKGIIIFRGILIRIYTVYTCSWWTWVLHTSDSNILCKFYLK